MRWEAGYSMIAVVFNTWSSSVDNAPSASKQTKGAVEKRTSTTQAP